MRKRVIIGLLAVVVIGVVAFFVSQPKRGTVEWHKDRYRALQRAIQHGTWPERAKNVLNRIVFGKVHGRLGVSTAWFEQLERHRRSLIELGYLEEREFVLSNRSIDHVIHESSRVIRADARWESVNWEFIHNSARGSNVLVTIAARQDMPIFVEAIRRADVP